jgi:hypothetical protein
MIGSARSRPQSSTERAAWPGLASMGRD